MESTASGLQWASFGGHHSEASRSCVTHYHRPQNPCIWADQAGTASMEPLDTFSEHILLIPRSDSSFEQTWPVKLCPVALGVSVGFQPLCQFFRGTSNSNGDMEPFGHPRQVPFLEAACKLPCTLGHLWGNPCRPWDCCTLSCLHGITTRVRPGFEHWQGYLGVRSQGAAFCRGLPQSNRLSSTARLASLLGIGLSVLAGTFRGCHTLITAARVPPVT